MGRIVAVLDGETALGFRLGGLEVREADTVEELVRQIEALLNEKDVRVVLLDEDRVHRIPERLERRLEASTAPIFLPIPTIRRGEGEIPPEEYATRLIRRAIGYQIKIRR